MTHGMKAIGPMKICNTWMNMDICRRKEKDKERRARKARLMKAKEEHQEMEKENPAMFNFRPHQPLLCRINNNKLITLQQHQAQGMVFLHLLRLTLHVWMFDSHPWRARVQETHSSRRTKPTWCSGTAKQRRRQEVSGFGWRSWSTSISSTTTTSASAQRSWFAGQWGFMEAIGERHFIVYAEILWKHGDTISAWMLCRHRGISWWKNAFSFHTTQPVQACENGLAFRTENSAPPTVCILGLGCTRAMGSRKAVEAFSADMLAHIQQWSLDVFGMKFIQQIHFVPCKFPTIQVHWEACDIHVWYWMEHSVHRIRYCRGRWCPIVAVTSTDENPWIPICTCSRQGLFVLCTYWHEKNGFEDSH